MPIAIFLHIHTPIYVYVTITFSFGREKLIENLLKIYGNDSHETLEIHISSLLIIFAFLRISF